MRKWEFFIWILKLNTPLKQTQWNLYIFTGFPKRTLLGWFIFQWVFLLSCVLPIKAERGGRRYIFTCMKTLNHFYFVVARRINRLTLLCEIDYLYPPCFVFVIGNKVLYFCFFRTNMNNEIHWSRRICRSRERKFKVTGEAKNQLGRNKLFAGHREGQVITKSTELYHWVGFTGFVT